MANDIEEWENALKNGSIMGRKRQNARLDLEHGERSHIGTLRYTPKLIEELLAGRGISVRFNCKISYGLT